VLDYVRGVPTGPDVLASIEKEVLRRAAELAQGDEVDADRSREKHVQREIERLTDAVAQMGLSPALAETGPRCAPCWATCN
ncbi:MAG TPA: hypothetical protein VL424_06125, partial [Pararobbsia sp.]|nr:hypothetical protein [Pararobbsia sp.]